MAITHAPSPTTVLVVIAGGMVGVAARAALVLPFGGDVHPMLVPSMTLAINLVGSLLLGVVVGRLGEGRPRLRAFVGTGMMGGFTTYSGFAVQTVDVFTAAPLVGLALAAVSVIGGVALAALGLRLGRGAAAPAAPEDAE